MRACVCVCVCSPDQSECYSPSNATATAGEKKWLVFLSEGVGWTGARPGWRVWPVFFPGDFICVKVYISAPLPLPHPFCPPPPFLPPPLCPFPHPFRPPDPPFFLPYALLLLALCPATAHSHLSCSQVPRCSGHRGKQRPLARLLLPAPPPAPSAGSAAAAKCGRTIWVFYHSWPIHPAPAPPRCMHGRAEQGYVHAPRALAHDPQTPNSDPPSNPCSNQPHPKYP